MMHQITTEPLLKKLLRYVMSDEARHVAFGVLSLQEFYKELTRRGAARAPGVRVRRGVPVAAAVHAGRGVGADGRRPGGGQAADRRAPAPEQQIFQQMLFSKIVPNCKKLGLLDAADGWLRERFTEIGVIQFEDWVDTGEEYAELDEVAKDRAAATAN